MAVHVTKAVYKHRKGVPAQGRSMVQLSGYIPDEKRVTELIKAGMLRAAYNDTAYEMAHELDLDNLPAIPPIPKAFGISTLADLSMLSAEFRARSEIVNERLAMAAEAGRLRKKVVSRAEPVVPRENFSPPEDTQAPEEPE